MRRLPPLAALSLLVALIAGSCAAEADRSAVAVGVDREAATTSTSAPLPVVTEEPVVASTTSVAPAADRPVSPGSANQRAATARLASDGTPTFDGDFADPFLLNDDGDIYAYATNTRFMNVPVLVARTDGGGEALGDALPVLPTWSEVGHVWAPSVTEIGDTYVLHYTTRHSASGRQCISVAVAEDPAGPFIDDSSEPLICTLDLGGSIDPSTIVDEDGTVWLLWKSDGNCCGIPTMIFAQPLSADGTDVVSPAVELIRNDLAWERDVVEAPSMIFVDGEYHLFYSANRWDTEAYAVGRAVCETVAGPCVKDAEPWLADSDATSGPGGLEVISVDALAIDLVVYHGWTGDLVGYDEGGQRSLYVRPIRWVDGEPQLIERPAA